MSAQALCSSISHGFRQTSQSTKTRSPAIRRNRAGCTKSFSLPKRAQPNQVLVYDVKVQAQSQLSFALRSQWRSFFKAIALNRTCVFGTFQSDGLSL
jgi:hypothetical protein